MVTELTRIMAAEGLMPFIIILGLMGVGIAMIWSGSGVRAKMVSQRIEKVAGGPDRDGGRASTVKTRPGERVTSQPDQGISEAEHRQIVRLYSRFGVSAESAFGYYQTTRLLLMVIMAAAAFPPARGLFATFFAAGLLAMAAPAAIGWLAPSLLLSRSVSKRSKAVSAGLPDALELLAVCIEAGLSLENGMQRVSTELKRSQPHLAEELALTWAEINILPNRDQALLNFAERVNTTSVRSVVSTLAQTLRYGTPLARSLRVVAADVRAEQLTALEEKANRLPALMTVPVMLFIMPTIFLIIGGPAALKLMDAFFK
jgi:tight adherence protein C